MPPRAKTTKISYMVDSASEDEFQRDDFDNLPTPDSAIENKAPVPKGHGRAGKAKPATTAAKAVKPKTAARRASGGSAAGAKKEKAAPAKKGPGKREALAEKEVANMSETEEVDEFAQDEETVAAQEEPKPVRRGRPPGKGKKEQEEESVVEAPKPAPARRGRKPAEPATTKLTGKGKAAGKTKAAKRAASPEPEPEPEEEQEPSAMTIAETQPEPEAMDLDVEESIEIEEIPESMPPPPPPASRRTKVQARTESRQRPTAGGRGRAGSASDTERTAGDPALRRKLGEMTKKFEGLQVKYENLKEIATSGKETNFDQLKRKTDQAAKEQEAVVRSLKEEMANLRARASDASSLKKEIARLEKENEKLSSENKTISTTLASAQNENKTLSTKLAAARSSAPPESRTVPGSAVKPRSVVLPGQAEAAKDVQVRQLKEDLYSDLTGLIVRGVKKNEEGDDVYDCIQTGRNGTLHFHLVIQADAEGLSYDETEFVYTPLLDDNRDRDLIDILPDYLTEEIAFPRSHAPKFYSKVVDCMTKKVIMEE